MRQLTFLAVALTIWAGAAASEGDVKAGKKVFRKCQSCHSLKPDDNRAGPTLYGVFGATSGSVEGFRYSGPMQQAGIVWDAATLTEFLTKPRALVPGTTMAFAGLRKPEQIDDLLAYLQSELADQ
ncbi:c-type cytochrome [Shimia sp. MMG029]|uniref:c-type cytochrome n=1 Tax=Shimia sp. MMG029 TaxID=3021978 RepID=UPI0022FE0F1D|nr:cytochrome c family protein [Shimia sp. MMG029]MDA5556480.1 cytochrome c family protein [Shimia sp. MMG029]